MNYDKYKLTTYKSFTVPAGFVKGELSPYEAVDYLTKIGLLEEGISFYTSLKSVQIPAGFSVTTPRGDTLPGGRFIPGFPHLHDWSEFQDYVQSHPEANWQISQTEEGEAEIPNEETVQNFVNDMTSAISQSLQDGDLDRANALVDEYEKDGMGLLDKSQHEKFQQNIDELKQIMGAYNSKETEDKVKEDIPHQHYEAMKTALEEFDSLRTLVSPMVMGRESSDTSALQVTSKYRKKEAGDTYDLNLLYGSLTALGETDAAATLVPLLNQSKKSMNLDFKNVFPFLKTMSTHDVLDFMTDLTRVYQKGGSNEEKAATGALYIKEFVANQEKVEGKKEAMSVEAIQKRLQEHSAELSRQVAATTNARSGVQVGVHTLVGTEKTNAAKNGFDNGQSYVRGIIDLFDTPQEAAKFLDRHFRLYPKGEGKETSFQKAGMDNLDALFATHVVGPTSAAVPAIQAIYKDLNSRLDDNAAKASMSKLLGKTVGADYVGEMLGLDEETAKRFNEKAVPQLYRALEFRSDAKAELDRKLQTALERTAKEMEREGDSFYAKPAALREMAQKIAGDLEKNPVMKYNGYSSYEAAQSARDAVLLHTAFTMSSFAFSNESYENNNYSIANTFFANFLHDPEADFSSGTFFDINDPNMVLSLALGPNFRGVPYDTETNELKFEPHQLRELLSAAGYPSDDLDILKDKSVMRDVMYNFTKNDGKMSYSQMLRNSFVRLAAHMTVPPGVSRRKEGTSVFTPEEVKDMNVTSVPYNDSQKQSHSELEGVIRELFDFGSGAGIMQRLAKINHKSDRGQIGPIKQKFQENLQQKLKSINLDDEQAGVIVDYYMGELSEAIKRRQTSSQEVVDNANQAYNDAIEEGKTEKEAKEAADKVTNKYHFGYIFENMSSIAPLISHIQESGASNLRVLSPAPRRKGDYFLDNDNRQFTGFYGTAGFTWQGSDGSTHVFGSPQNRNGEAVDFSHIRFSPDYSSMDVTPYEAKMIQKGTAYAHQAAVDKSFYHIAEAMVHARKQGRGNLPSVNIREMRNINQSQNDTVEVASVDNSLDRQWKNMYTGGFAAKGEKAS